MPDPLFNVAHANLLPKIALYDVNMLNINESNRIPFTDWRIGMERSVFLKDDNIYLGLNLSSSMSIISLFQF